MYSSYSTMLLSYSHTGQKTKNSNPIKMNHCVYAVSQFFLVIFQERREVEISLFCNAMRYFFPIKNLAALFNVKNIDNEKGKKMLFGLFHHHHLCFKKISLPYRDISLFSIRFNMMMMTHTELAAALATTTTITNNHYRPKWRQFGY